MTIRLTELFGALALMHAIADRRGLGVSCGIMALFDGVGASDVRATVEAVTPRYAVLQQRLVVENDRPVLVPSSSDPFTPGMAIEQLLEISPAAMDGKLWHYSLQEDERGTWLSAAWAHSIAD